MNAIELLTTRRSSKQLTTPAPSDAQVQTMLQAATQVPDHGLLNPYRFVVVDNDQALQRFSHVLLDAAKELNLGEEGEQKAKRIGSMAPLVIGVIASPKAGKPEWEQQLTAGCSAYAIQLAAKAQGFDNVWISGKWVGSDALRHAFACQEYEQIIALLLIGTGKTTVDGEKNSDWQAFVTHW